MLLPVQTRHLRINKGNLVQQVQSSAVRGCGAACSVAAGVNKPVGPPRGVAAITGKQADKVRSAGEQARASNKIVPP